MLRGVLLKIVVAGVCLAGDSSDWGVSRIGVVSVKKPITSGEYSSAGVITGSRGLFLDG